nr:YibE/F family protein [Sedimentibacter sp.]
MINSGKIVLLIIILQLALAFPAFADAEISDMIDAKGKVLEVFDEKSGNEMGYDENSLVQGVQKVKILITTGEYKGREVVVENYLQGNPIYDIKVKEGQKIVMTIDNSDPENVQFFISSYERDIYLYILIVAFLVLILVIGKIQGLKSIATLFITMAIVFMYTIPTILKGTNPIIASVLSCIVITMVTMITLSGFNQKAISAIIGTATGIIIAGLITYVISKATHLSGLDTNEATMLLYIPQGTAFNFNELLFAGIIIGTMGATMDISMSVASSMNEVLTHNPTVSIKSLMSSGLNVGRDVMGTMTNTLILAYTGSSMSILLVFFAYKTSIMGIMNLDIIATEVVRSISGSIGIILSVPCTALTVGVLENIKRSKQLDKKI